MPVQSELILGLLLELLRTGVLFVLRLPSRQNVSLKLKDLPVLEAKPEESGAKAQRETNFFFFF